MIKRDLTNIVAVVDRRNGHRCEVEHRLHMDCTRRGGGIDERGVLLVIATRVLPLSQRPARGQVAVDEIVRGCLIRHQIGLDAARFRATYQLGQDVCGVAEQADGDSALLIGVFCDAGQRVIQIARLLIKVARLDAELDVRLLAFDIERTGTRKLRRQRLRATHAAEPRRQNPSSGKTAAEMLATGLHKRLVGALHNAL